MGKGGNGYYQIRSGKDKKDMKQFPSTLLVHNEKEVDTNTNPGVFGLLPDLPSAPAKWILLLLRLPTTILCPSSSLVSLLSSV